MRRLLYTCFFLVSSAVMQSAVAQSFGDLLKAGSKSLPDLEFPSEVKDPAALTLGMGLYKPAGPGPFPAVVLVHSCGGLRGEILTWAKETLDRGYTALILDSMGPRGISNNCSAPAKLRPSRATKDIYQALAHLKTHPFIDAKRIGLVGFSLGGGNGLLASSTEASNALADGHRYAAVAALYPICDISPQVMPPGIEFLRADTDNPVLVLMAEGDYETPPADCIARLEPLKKEGVAVDWHKYPTATHCWDCLTIDGQTKKDFKGYTIHYKYDKETTKDSVRRTFEFLDKYLKEKK